MTVTTEINVGNHEIECTFNVIIENDGIGEYEYWGAKGYDYGTDYAVLDEILKCRIIRAGRIERKEDAPACADEILTYTDKDGKEYYRWFHYREVSANDEIEEAINDYVNNSSLDDFVEDTPDYDERWEE